MKVTDEAIDLIKMFEGFRSRAYRDPVGIWTVGYGHTSMAGEPAVHAGLAVDEAQAREILEQDVEKFASGVRKLLQRHVSDAQFSALVSFAYNVGLDNLAKSSVLAAVNAGDQDAVPRRLALWVKAGGRTLPGLVRRRAAEAAMFTEGGRSLSCPDVPQHKPAYASKTLISSLMIILAAAAQAATGAASTLCWLLFAAIGAAAIVIAFERLKKLKQEGL